jgi:uncharacterized protein YbbC (DUF1343 family)
LAGVSVLSPLSVIKMTTPQSPPDHSAVRGLGWDLDSPYSSTRGDLLPLGSYGHTGFTGTSLWIDPTTEIYVVLMTNRVHPTVRTSVVSLRSHVATIAAAAIEDLDEEELRRAAWSRRVGRAAKDETRRKAPRGRVLTGLDVLVREDFARLRGKRVGLITNHTGIDRDRRRNIDLLRKADGVTLKAIFSPEHGVAGALDQPAINDGIDPASEIPIYSLYQGERRRRTPQMLQAIDALVFDIQDIGARFYTYVTTMAYAMEEAAKHEIDFYVLDRPNPITGTVVEGPPLDPEYRSFIGYFPMPVRHGMTVGELARMFNEEGKIGAQLEVIPMEDWDRRAWFDETGLPWVNPSPNIRTLDQALLYPGVALLEGLRNYSVGRGTDTPFQFVGADWLDADALAAYLNRRDIAAARFYAVERSPKSSRFSDRSIEGVQITVLDRERLRSTRLGLELAAALIRFYPEQVRLEETAKLVGHRATLENLEGGHSPNAIWREWEAAQTGFLEVRRRYLLY